MFDERKTDDRRQVVREALRAIDDLQARLAEAHGALRAPIAIVGIGCRYPGDVTGPDSFWQMLCAGTDAIREVPAERWDISAWYDADRSVPGKMSTRWGGFLSQVDRFDAEFFGISPREAAVLDPQHRILLEVAWESLEHSGQPFANLAGSQTGIFVGLTSNEYYQNLLRTLEPASLSPYLATGNVLNAAAGRLAYFLGTHGPSMAVDTACSSSLTAVHLACQSLRAGECRMALAGGVNVIVVPETCVMFSKWGMMAADGRCKTFDAAADGFVRSEGCGIVVLKRLSDALAAGDRILAVIEGSAVNQDGRSSGLTVPNGVAQQALIRQALANAGVEPGQIDYVEAHGTGTSLGDPIEVEALSAVFGPRRDQGKLRIGSVKTNLGHTESASGVAGLIKCVLALEHEQLPQQLHFRRPTPEIAWDSIPVEVVAEPVAWPRGAAPRRAGVSSFGFSGANAHVVVGEAPAVRLQADPLIRPRQILAFSARDPQALTELAERYASALGEQGSGPLADFCYTANTGRAQFQHRAAVSAASSAELAGALSRFADPDDTPLARGQWSGEPLKIAFLFTGQGSQYVGMGRQLYDSQPVFRVELDRCAALLVPYLDRPLLEILFGPADRSPELDQTGYTQPALFALEWSLAQMWRSWGVAPAALLGHSVGEYVAACQAGVMSLDDGLQLISARARLMQSLPSDGMMAAVACDEATVRRLLAPHAAVAAIAAVNGPRNVVVSGRSDIVEKIIEQLRAQQIMAVPLTVSHAFHSPLLTPILEPLERIAAAVQYHRPHTPLVANLTGAFAQHDEVASAAYWRSHAQSPVRFADGIQQLDRKGCRLFLEIGPAPVLINMGRHCVDASGQGWFASLVKGRDEWTQVLQSLAELYARGVSVDWAGFDHGYRRRRLALPTYPFQRKRFWVDKDPSSDVAPTGPCRGDTMRGAMLQRTEVSPLVKEVIFSGELGTRLQPWLGDHVVGGHVFVPMTTYIEMVMAAAVDVLQTRSVAIEDLVLRAPLIVTGDETAKLQLVLNPSDSPDTWEFRIISLERSTPNGWLLHASGRLLRQLDVETDERRAREGLACAARHATCSIQLDQVEHYRVFAAQGIDFGAAFRGVQRVFHAAGKSIGEIQQHDSALAAAPWVFHPALLDACLQPLVHAWPAQFEPGTFLPFAVERIDFWGAPTAVMKSYCQARGSAGGRADTLVGDVTLCDASGKVVGAVRGLTVRRSDVADAADRVSDWLYEVEWRRVPAAAAVRSSSCAIPPVAVAAARAGQNRQTYVDRATAQGYSQAARLLDALSLKYVASALESLGWNPQPGETVSRHLIAAQLGAEARHTRLLARMLDMLAAAGCFDSVPDGWLVKRTLASVDRSVEPAAALDALGAFRAEFTLLERCGTRLADVLRGNCDPLDLLFSADASENLEKLYSDSPATTTINQLAADVFAGLVEHLPEQGKLRVLEIGAGTGGTTAHVLGHLPADRTEYCFTDISPALVGRARWRFEDFPFVEFEVLDIGRDLESQGFADRQFDVVLAANVLHATADLRGALASVQQLLAPGGLLVLAEGTRPQNWIDLTFGLTDGWWKFTDVELRPDYPLLATRDWLRLLVEQGFSNPLALGGPAAAGQASDYSLLIASGSSRLPAVGAERDVWLVFVDDQGTGNRVAAELTRHAQSCLTVRRATAYEQYSAGEFGLDPAARGDYARLLEALENSGRQCRGIVHLWSLDAILADTGTSEQLGQAHDRSCRSLLYLAQAMANSGQSLAAGLWVLTRGSQAVDRDVHRVAAVQATVWGLGKVLALEHPELRVARLDLDPAATTDDSEAKLVAAVLLRPLEEAQWALRSGLSYAARLVRKVDAAGTGPVRLNSTQPGRLDSLTWQPTTRRAPGPGEVEIRVEAVGLNFRDVLNALDMYPGDAGPLGGEVAGVVVAVGPGVGDLAVGDAVAALAVGGFDDYVVTAADLTIRKPADWSFAEIASVPAAFATAYHALVQLAQIRRGQTILIHAAAGGVGLAAVQLALQAGCEIIATAGSPEKRDYLRRIGVAHIFDSRSLTFAEGVRSLALAGGGVDVILNTLSGEFIAASLALLSPRGCFVELGKRDIWDASRVASVRPEAAYFIVDLAARSQQAPAEFRPIWAAAGAAIGAGTLRPLPVQVFPRDQVQAAFRHMAQARHIGKIVVSGGTKREDSVPQPFSADPTASYLITGGLAGLGLRTAEWLAARGAKHLALMARSEPTDETRQAVAALRAAGVEVLVCRGDVARTHDVARVLDEILAGAAQLRGVIHSAGVLDDGVILQQDWSRFERVFGPKLAGAWNLHQATRNMRLDFFVCYSSASAILGSRGQGNHAAANAFLDALAHHRRGLGLPALSINWGAWSGIGAAARRGVFDRVADYGVAPLDPAQGIAALERLIVDGSVQAAVIPMDWTRFLSTERPPAERSFFAELGTLAASRTALRASDKVPSLESQLKGAHPADRRKLIQSHLRDAVVRVLGLEPEFEFDPLRGFRDLGFDSLMSIELRNRLQASLGRPLPATLVFDFPSLAALVDYFHKQCVEQTAEPPREPGRSRCLGEDVEFAAMHQLSPAETERLLAAELAKSRELLS